MRGLLNLAVALSQPELAAVVCLRERVQPQEGGLWQDCGSDQVEFSYHVPGQLIVHAARMMKRGEVWDCFDLTHDNHLIGTYHMEDAIKAVGDWFSVIEEIQPAQVAGAAL